ncbi:hypothetical protein N0824_03572 [Microcystis sp. 0824]|nr:hypothetical protein N0824_03572 [Microcystis sp. 0824]
MRLGNSLKKQKGKYIPFFWLLWTHILNDFGFNTPLVENFL